jgi:hypothetical protein
MSIGDIISLSPVIGTLYNAIVDPKGSDIGDYIINISSQLCCELGDSVAELKCKKSVSFQVASYELQYNGLFFGHSLVDAVFGYLAVHPIARIVFGVDAIVDMLITFRNVERIGDAGRHAANKCNCELYK